MILFENVYNLMENCKTPYVKIKDFHGNIIMSFEDDKLVPATIKKIQAIEDMLRGYGKLEVLAATETQKNANYKGAYKWLTFFEDANKKGNPQQMGFVGGYQQQPNMWGAPGFIHQSVMEAKLAALEAKLDYNTKLKDLERQLSESKRKKDSPMDEYLPLVPVIMSGMGKSDESIEKMMKWYAMGKMQQSNSIAGTATAPTNTLTFKDVEKMSAEEKNQKIQTLLDSVSEKISAEHMILLLEAINNKPELAVKAVDFLKMM